MMSPLVLGAALGVVGLVGYLGTGRKSVTALIPLFFGVIFIALGALGGPGGIAGTAALALAVLGILGTARSYVSLAKGERGAATLSKAAMATLCVAFLVLRTA